MVQRAGRHGGVVAVELPAGPHLLVHAPDHGTPPRVSTMAVLYHILLYSKYSYVYCTLFVCLLVLFFVKFLFFILGTPVVLHVFFFLGTHVVTLHMWPVVLFRLWYDVIHCCVPGIPHSKHPVPSTNPRRRLNDTPAACTERRRRASKTRLDGKDTQQTRTHTEPHSDWSIYFHSWAG